MSAPSRLRHRVGEYIQTQRLWEPGDVVHIAVSGGVDSVVLLDVLAETTAWHKGRLQVVTVDHQTRPDSHENAAFVQALAAQYGLPVRSSCAHPTDHSEAALRAARYAVFEEQPDGVVALGHHRDDQAETFLLALLRGAGVRGLAGMRPRRDRYVRPLLLEPREALMAYATARGLDWREDPSNVDTAYARNRIRIELLPALETMRSGASAAIARTAQRLREDDDALTRLASEHDLSQPPWPTTWLSTGTASLVRRQLLHHVPDASSAHIDAIVDAARRGRGTITTASRVVTVEGGVAKLTGKEASGGQNALRDSSNPTVFRPVERE